MEGFTGSVWRVIQGPCGGFYRVSVEGYTGATTAAVEDPPDLKKENIAKTTSGRRDLTYSIKSHATITKSNIKKVKNRYKEM